jgi:RNA polymerase sigma-70 factor, ECF subfamily
MYARDPLSNPEPLVRRVYAYVAYRIGDGPDAEDVTSDVFERALRYRRSYNTEKGEPAAWLIGIARRCISEHRASQAIVIAEATDKPAPGDEADEAVRRLALAAAVTNLSERDRELIALRYGADLTASQIAKVLGQTTNSVEVGLHRALARLRVALTEEKPDEDAVSALKPMETRGLP